MADERVCGLVADATVERPNEPALNGWRLLTACGRDHLLELTARYQSAHPATGSAPPTGSARVTGSAPVTAGSRDA